MLSYFVPHDSSRTILASLKQKPGYGLVTRYYLKVTNMIFNNTGRHICIAFHIGKIDDLTISISYCINQILLSNSTAAKEVPCANKY